MKLTVFLSGLLLYFLLLYWTESVEEQNMNLTTLARIINFFEQKYKIVDENGDPRQYATAINVPKNQCQRNFCPTQNNFLTQENAVNVKNAINGSDALYQGSELIAAGTRKMNMHSESLLLNPANNSLMLNLLNKTKDGCSVFYTLNFPCVNTSLNATNSHSISEALRYWKARDGIKAFVFKNLTQFDIKRDLRQIIEIFRQIVAHVPLFRCVSKNQCYACKGENNSTIEYQCLEVNFNITGLSSNSTCID